MTAERYDAFVSYGHGDADWVHALAENLECLDLHVFLDDWELVPGDLLAVKLQEGLAAADAVVFVVSAQSVRRGWVNEEFAAAIAKAAAGQRRLIPVIYDDVVLPEFVASRFYIDFRNLDSPAAYEAKVRELAAAIRGRPRGVRPRPGGGIVPPSGAYRAEGPRSVRLTITEDLVTFSTEARAVRHQPAGLNARAIALLNQAAVSRTRPGAGPLRAAGTGTAAAGMHAALVQAGTALGQCFLGGAAGQALADEIAAATEGGAAVRLAVDVPEARLAGLPWGPSLSGESPTRSSGWPTSRGTWTGHWPKRSPWPPMTCSSMTCWPAWPMLRPPRNYSAASRCTGGRSTRLARPGSCPTWPPCPARPPNCSIACGRSGRRWTRPARPGPLRPPRT